MGLVISIVGPATVVTVPVNVLPEIVPPRVSELNAPAGMLAHFSVTPGIKAIVPVNVFEAKSTVRVMLVLPALKMYSLVAAPLLKPMAATVPLNDVAAVGMLAVGVSCVPPAYSWMVYVNEVTGSSCHSPKLE